LTWLVCHTVAAALWLSLALALLASKYLASQRRSAELDYEGSSKQRYLLVVLLPCVRQPAFKVTAMDIHLHH